MRAVRGFVWVFAVVLATAPVAGGAPKKGGKKAEPSSKRVEPPPKKVEASTEQVEDDLRAKKMFDDATRAFNLGEFLTAVNLYRGAYKLKPEPGLLYNIAQAYRLSNDPGNAVFFYRSFLRAAPNTPNRKEVEGRIAKLEAQVNEQKAPPNAPVGLGSMPEGSNEPTTTTTENGERTTTTTTTAPARTDLVAAPPRADKPLHKKWWLWTVVGVGVVGVSLGLGLGLGLQSRAPSSHFGTRPVF